MGDFQQLLTALTSLEEAVAVYKVLYNVWCECGCGCGPAPCDPAPLDVTISKQKSHPLPS